MNQATKQEIAKKVNGDLTLLRMKASQIENTDGLYAFLVRLDVRDDVDWNKWEQVLEANDYFHIQNSHDFCGYIKSLPTHKYDKYADYVKKLGTDYFAPAYENGMHGAVLMMAQSIIIYLNNELRVFDKTKAQYKAQLKTMHESYQQRSRKQDTKSNATRAYEAQDRLIKNPQSVNDVLEALKFYLDRPLHFGNLFNDWLDVHYLLGKYNCNNHEDFQFARSGVLNTYANGYAVGKDKRQPTGEQNAKKSKLYTLSDFSDDVKRTYQNIKAEQKKNSRKQNHISFSKIKVMKPATHIEQESLF